MPTALVIEGSKTDQRLAQGLLARNHSLVLQFASSGSEALDLIEQELPELILTDIDKLNADGVDLLAVLRDRCPDVPVILMTSNGDEPSAFKALAQGATSFVPRSRMAHDLVWTVERVLADLDRTYSDPRLNATLRSSQSSSALRNEAEFVRSFVHGIQQDLAILDSWNTVERLRMCIALEEALLNAMYHGNLEVWPELRTVNRKAYHQMARQRAQQDPYCQRRIHVEAQLTRLQTTFVIRDEGSGFDTTCLPDPSDTAGLRRRSGRGLLLMRLFMDEMTFNDAGNEVTLIKRARRQHGHEASPHVHSWCRPSLAL